MFIMSGISSSVYCIVFRFNTACRAVWLTCCNISLFTPFFFFSIVSCYVPRTAKIAITYISYCIITIDRCQCGCIGTFLHSLWYAVPIVNLQAHPLVFVYCCSIPSGFMLVLLSLLYGYPLSLCALQNSCCFCSFLLP